MIKNLLLGIVAVAATTTSCVKRQTIEPVANGEQIGSAIIKGTFLGKTDYVGDTLPNGNNCASFECGWSGLAGLPVIITVSENNFDNDFTTNAQVRSYSGTTDANGDYAITVDAVSKGVTYTVYVNGEVTASVLHKCPGRAKFNTTIGDFDKTTETLTFRVDYSTPVTVIKDQTKVITEVGYHSREITDAGC